MSEFYLSARSLERLDGVHPHIVAIVKHAITITRSTSESALTAAFAQMSDKKELKKKGGVMPRVQSTYYRMTDSDTPLTCGVS